MRSHFDMVYHIASYNQSEKKAWAHNYVLYSFAWLPANAYPIHIRQFLKRIATFFYANHNSKFTRTHCLFMATMSPCSRKDNRRKFKINPALASRLPNQKRNLKFSFLFFSPMNPIYLCWNRGWEHGFASGGYIDQYK